MQHKSAEKLNDVATMKHNILHYVMGETEKGMNGNPQEVEILEKYIHMVKELAETEKACQEACYYESVVDAMDSSGMLDSDRMGYNPNRNSRGEYSDGRSSNGGSSRSQGNNRMGYYTPEMPYKRMMDYDDEDPVYGKSFDRFRKAKRHYTESHSETDKERMRQASNDHMTEAMSTIREIWDSADPDLRKRMKTDLTTLVSTMN